MFTHPSDGRLQIGGIYLLLYIRDPDVGKGFHWALYHHRSPHSGYKFNVKQEGAGWICNSEQTTAIMNTFLLDIALRIGYCDVARGVQELKWIDEVSLTEPPAPFDVFTCLTWTLHCILGLTLQGFVNCNDLDALKKKAQDWGTRYHQSAHDGEHPRPVEDLKVCFSKDAVLLA